jgi:RimJ/RimL family protein N-acetyltransferase
VLLETERLRLRQFTAGDVGNLVELDSDPEVMRYINGGREAGLKYVRTFHQDWPDKIEGEEKRGRRVCAHATRVGGTQRVITASTRLAHGRRTRRRSTIALVALR